MTPEEKAAVWLQSGGINQAAHDMICELAKALREKPAAKRGQPRKDKASE